MGDPFRLTLELLVEDTGAWKLSVNGAPRWMKVERSPAERPAIVTELGARVAAAVAGWVHRVESTIEEPEGVVPKAAVLQLAKRIEAQADCDESAEEPPGRLWHRLRVTAKELRRLCRMDTAPAGEEASVG